MSRRRLLASRRAPWVVFAVAIVGLAVYVFLAVVSQPLVSSGPEGADHGVIQQCVYQAAPGPSESTVRVVAYMDGGRFTLVKWLRNVGPVGLTVTGVAPAPSYWVGLLGVPDSRPAVLVGSESCCIIDSAATWAMPGFRPLRIGPGQAGAIAVRFLLGYCEYNSFGGAEGIRTITVHYRVLGMPGRPPRGGR